MRAIAAIRPDPTICISGRSGEGLPELLSLIASKLSAGLEEVEVLLPHTRGDLVEQVGGIAGLPLRSAPWGLGLRYLCATALSFQSQRFTDSPLSLFIPVLVSSHTERCVWLLSMQLHTTGEVQALEYREDGVLVRAKVPPSVAGRVEEYSTRSVERRTKRIGRRRRSVTTWEEEEGAGDGFVLLDQEAALRPEDEDSALSPLTSALPAA